MQIRQAVRIARTEPFELEFGARLILSARRRRRLGEQKPD
jgi:hypothetical protein